MISNTIIKIIGLCLLNYFLWINSWKWMAGSVTSYFISDSYCTFACLPTCHPRFTGHCCSFNSLSVHRETPILEVGFSPHQKIMQCQSELVVAKILKTYKVGRRGGHSEFSTSNSHFSSVL